MLSGSLAMAATAFAGTPRAMKPMPGPEPSEKSMACATIACCMRASPANAIDVTSRPCLAQMPCAVPISIGAKANVVAADLPTRMLSAAPAPVTPARASAMLSPARTSGRWAGHLL